MKTHYRLWTLNATTQLLERKHRKLKRIYGPRGSWGRRKGCNAGPESTTTNLMYEKVHEETGRKDYDEYFVPIIIKAMGRYILNDDEKIRQLWAPYGRDPQKILETYWTEGLQNGAHEIDVITRMNTKDFKGYYELLKEESEAFAQKHPGHQLKHVLIGYSQGGLVALFLAWLDEALLKEDIIDSVITLQAPVLGSPLANPANRNAVSRGLGELIFRLLGFYHNDPEIKKLYQEALDQLQPEEDGLSRVTLALDKLGLALKADLDNDRARGLRMENNLLNFRKWLSGVKGEVEYAFSDLNCTNLLLESSVLNLINNHPFTRIKMANITGSSSSMSDILDTNMNSTPVKIGLFFLSPLFALARTFGFRLIRHLHLFGKTLEENLSRVEKYYSTNILCDPSYPQIPEVYAAQKRQENRQEEGRGLGDLIIPAEYQSMVHIPRSGPILEWENPKASHYTGFRRTTQGGRDNIKMIYRFLKKLHRS